MDYFCPTTARVHRALLGSHGYDHADDFLAYDREPQSVAVSYLHEKVFRKFHDPDAVNSVPVVDLEREALDKFLAVERRLRNLESDKWVGNVNDVLAGARRYIRDALGRFDLGEFSNSLGLSNGASSRLRRRKAHPVYKLGGRPHVTRNCALLAAHLYWHTPSLKAAMTKRFGEFSTPDEWFEVVEGSEQFSVPKTATSVRLAAKEPELNLLFQKGIGLMIRRRLYRKGINLNDDTLNQMYARTGSRTGSLATIDLQSASDSVSLEILRELLPWKWFQYIFITRSPCMKLLNGQRCQLSKVSTMGNGFTFELESLIFWALAKACQDQCGQPDKRLAVFGDDIVMHHESARILVDIFPKLGFVVNEDKTFLDGPFRESCGGHYWLGKDIKPFYLQKGYSVKATRKAEVVFLINAYLDWAWRVQVEPNLPMVRWLLKTYAPDAPIVPLEADPRSGVYGGPRLGVHFNFRRSAYVLRTYDVGADEELKRLTSGTAFAVWLLLGGIPGRKTGFRATETTVYAEPRVSCRLVKRYTSRWSVPDYDLEWMGSLFE